MVHILHSEEVYLCMKHTIYPFPKFLLLDIKLYIFIPMRNEGKGVFEIVQRILWLLESINDTWHYLKLGLEIIVSNN